MIDFVCTKCGSALRIKDEAAGRQIPCPKCESTIQVPGGAVQESPGREPRRTTEKRLAPLMPLILSVVACVIAGAALTIEIFRPARLPGRGLDAYDLSTPKKAARARLEMRANQDLRAMTELRMVDDQDAAKEELESFVVHRTMKHDGKTLVLYKVRSKGLDRHKKIWLEEKNGIYIDTWVFTSGWNTQGGDKARIYRIMADWTAKDYK